MPRLTKAVPKYQKHRASGQAVVRLNGRDFYLGPHGTKTSKLEYDRLVGEWLAAGRQLPKTPNEEGVAVAELIARYWRFAQGYYRKNGEATKSLYNVQVSLRPLKRLYGRTMARDFGPLALKAIREVMVKEGLSRGVINKRIGIIKQVFKWAVAEELVPPELSHGLAALSGLRKGRTEAPDHAPIGPVPEADVQAALPYMSEVVADMVRFQRLTGCRPAEVCTVRPCDVDRSGEVWTYQPASHKTEHHGRQRLIFIGPKAQAILTPYLLREADAFCFSPVDSERKRRAGQRVRRKTKVQPSQRDRRVAKPNRTPRERYDTNTYRRSVQYACQKAGVAPWAPNRLRHSAATSIRKRFGLEAAQVSLGHATADVSQLYAERDFGLAREVARKIG